MKALLFTTLSCPKCPAFKETVKNNVEFDVQYLDDLQPEFFDLAQQMSVSAVPTMVIFENDQEVFRTSDGGELLDFLKR